MVRKRVISCLLRKYELCLHICPATETSPCCSSQYKDTTVHQVSIPHIEALSSVSNWPTCSHRKVMAEQSKTASSFPTTWLDTSRQECHLHRCQTNVLTLKEMWMFHWLLKSACQGGKEEVGGGKEKEPSRIHFSIPFCQKNYSCSICLLTKGLLTWPGEILLFANNHT